MWYEWGGNPLLRLVHVFHIYVHRYLRKRSKEALTFLKQLFKFAHVDG